MATAASGSCPKPSSPPLTKSSIDASMPLHQAIQKLLLLGAHVDSLPPPAVPRPPQALVPLIDAISGPHKRFDERALHYGHRYRSGFWAIYLLSAIAVLFAVMPLALGWDSANHLLHPYAGLWAVGEVGLIGTVSAIYWLGHRRDWQAQWLRARTTAELSWYLPLLAPLLDFTGPTTAASATPATPASTAPAMPASTTPATPASTTPATPASTAPA